MWKMWLCDILKIDLQSLSVRFGFGLSTHFLHVSNGTHSRITHHFSDRGGAPHEWREKRNEIYKQSQNWIKMMATTRDGIFTHKPHTIERIHIYTYIQNFG